MPITPAKLASRAVTGYPTALRWLILNYWCPSPTRPPLLPLLSLPPLPSSLLNQNPTPKPAQKQPDPKRVTVKANANKLLPKPLRNPKTHPELPTTTLKRL